MRGCWGRKGVGESGVESVEVEETDVGDVFTDRSEWRRGGQASFHDDAGLVWSVVTRTVTGSGRVVR